MDKIEEAKKILNELIDETLSLCKKDTTSKDGYVTMMSLLTKIPPRHQNSFLNVCVSKGYPKDTADTIKRIMGI